MNWGTRNKALAAKGFDEAQWQKYYHRHQQEYIRRRLKAIRLYYSSVKREQIAKELQITYKTLSGYLDLYLSAGLQGLVSPIVKPRLQSLNQAQQDKLADMILHESPQDYSKKGTSGL
jgi:transposase